jgi:hypothetical protein
MSHIKVVLAFNQALSIKFLKSDKDQIAVDLQET